MIYKNCLFILTYRNRLIYLMKAFLNNSEIIAFIFKIFKKCLQNMNNPNIILSLDLSQLTEFPDKIMEGIVDSFIDKENKNSFINTLQITMLKYLHYPELIINTFQIILLILKKTKENNLINFLEIFDLNKFQGCFEIYKFKLRGCFKEINFLFLNILFILISFFKQKNTKKILLKPNNEIILDKDLDFKVKFLKIFENLVQIFCGFFDTTHRRYIDFTKRKFMDLQLQDLLLRMGSTIIFYESSIENILNSDFMNNLIRFVLEYRTGKCEYVKNNTHPEKNKAFDYLDFIYSKKIKNFDTVKKITSSIILNVLDIYANLLDHENKYFTIVANNVNKFFIKYYYSF